VIIAIQPTQARVGTTTLVFVVKDQGMVGGEPILRANQVWQIAFECKSDSLLYVSARRVRPFLPTTPKKVLIGSREVMFKIEYLIDTTE
jgi:hypothetical protein